ncbi:MAG: hypothetical protein MHPSP_001127, partial [Paramarteilia canceri]
IKTRNVFYFTNFSMNAAYEECLKRQDVASGLFGEDRNATPGQHRQLIETLRCAQALLLHARGSPSIKRSRKRVLVSAAKKACRGVLFEWITSQRDNIQFLKNVCIFNLRKC